MLTNSIHITMWPQSSNKQVRTVRPCFEYADNGEIEDIYFDELNSNVYVENFVIDDKNVINFINNFIKTN